MFRLSYCVERYFGTFNFQREIRLFEILTCLSRFRGKAIIRPCRRNTNNTSICSAGCNYCLRTKQSEELSKDCVSYCKTRGFAPRCVDAESLGLKGSMIGYTEKNELTKNINLINMIYSQSFDLRISSML